jgi:dolichol kinase
VRTEPSDAELARLVARTEGPQPWRKAFHAVNAVLISGAVVLADRWGWPNSLVVAALAAMAVGLLLTDFVRLNHRGANALFFRAFARLASPREAAGVASSTWYAWGIFAAVAFFPRREALGGVLVLGLADPAAAYVGRTFGRTPFLGGTLEGSLAFFATAILVLGVPFGWGPAAAAALLATLAERRSWPLDDNLAVPVVCAGALYFLGQVN